MWNELIIEGLKLGIKLSVAEVTKRGLLHAAKKRWPHLFEPADEYEIVFEMDDEEDEEDGEEDEDEDDSAIRT